MGYTYVWEFHIRPESRDEFEAHYGSAGTWVALFRQSREYIGTLLLKDRANPERYLTVDRWSSEAGWHEFQARFADQYAALDKQCERLTISEVALGTFSD